MWEIIKSLIKSAFNDSTYPKVIDCLIALRQGAVKMEEPALFNNGLVDLKNGLGAKKPTFWALVAGKDIRPIDSSEVADSTFSPEQAKQFHSGSGAVSSASSSSGNNNQSDDVWDSMA